MNWKLKLVPREPWALLALIVAFTVALGAGQAQAQEEKEERGFFSRVKQSLSSVDVSPAEGNIVLVTMEDIDRPYELVAALPAVAMQEWGGSSSRRPGGGLSDPGLTSITRALQSLQEIAKKQGADAVIGVKLDFESPANGEEGRAVVYGTLIRYVLDKSVETPNGEGAGAADVSGGSPAG